MKPAGLIYYPDTKSGFARKRRGKGFSYLDTEGQLIADMTTRQRLAALAVPPAYEEVWMCPVENGHLLATGRDERGRKQYIYHPDWTAFRAQLKFDDLPAFGRALPRIRRRVQADLQEDAGEREFALAAAVTLIDRTALRVGSPQYVEENNSYGALTLRNRHISLSGKDIALNYRAKGGQKVRTTITDAKLVRILDKISDLPGANLLAWVDDAGDPQSLSSEALNAYIADAAGQEGITAKTFRTWAGTCAAFDVGVKGNATIKDMATAAADILHNTPTVARNSYIHPAVVALADQRAPRVKPAEQHGLKVNEQHLLGFLESK